MKGPADLKGKTIAVNRGTLEDTEVTKVAPEGADIQRYNDYNGVISAFLSGQAQLMVVGNDVGATILAQEAGDRAGREVPAPDLAFEHGGQEGRDAAADRS